MYDWLSSQISTFATNITTNFIFCIITLTSIAVIIFLLHCLKKRRLSSKRKKHPPRLTLCETIAIDRTRHLVLVRCDDKEHLLLIGGFTDIVVESNITSTSLIQTKEIQPTLTTTKISPNQDLGEKRSFPVETKDQVHDSSTAPFMKQQVKDSAITAEIEGRQEPSLFIPAQNK